MDNVVTLSKFMLLWPLPKNLGIPQAVPSTPPGHADSPTETHNSQSAQLQPCLLGISHTGPKPSDTVVRRHSLAKISSSQIFQAEPQATSASERLGSWALMPHSADSSACGPHKIIRIWPWAVAGMTTQLDCAGPPARIGWCVNREDLHILGFQVLPRMSAVLIPWEQMHHPPPWAPSSQPLFRLFHGSVPSFTSSHDTPWPLI